jgi:3-oxoacyl-[acyl-carrier protein] reductase
MMTQRFGRIVFISSIAARGMKGDPAYCASKAGMLGLSGALSKEYGGRGITSNALILGFFNTDMTRDGAAVGKRELFVKHCPAGRTGEVDEVAAAVLYLASREAAFVNGQEIGLTGGLDHTP